MIGADVHTKPWVMVLAYVVSIVAWLAFALPSGLLASEDGVGVGGVIESFSTGILIAAAIRFGYALLRHRPFFSPWLFALAAPISFLTYLGQVGHSG